MRNLNTTELDHVTGGRKAGGGMMSPDMDRTPPDGGSGGHNNWDLDDGGWFYETNQFTDLGGSGGGGGGGIELPIDTIPGFGDVGVYGTWGSTGPQLGLYDQAGNNLGTLTADGSGGYFASYTHTSDNLTITADVGFGSHGTSASVHATYTY